MSTSIKFFHNEMSGAPVLSGTPGALIAVLDACLVNGWGTQTVDSVVIAGGVATVTRASGHPFEADMVAQIAGATVTGGSINGQRKILSTTATSYTFSAAGIPNQTAGGSITHQIASAGWSKPFSATDVAVYRSLDPTSTQFYLWVNDTTTLAALARGYESMVNINDDTSRFPRDGQVPGGFRWFKSNYEDSAPRRWLLIADGVRFYFMTDHWGPSGNNHSLYGFFGDIAAAGSNDAYRCAINGFPSDDTSTPGSNSFSELDHAYSSGNAYLARPQFGIGQPVKVVGSYPTFMNGTSGDRSGSVSTDHIQFPNSSDGGVYVAPFFVTNSSDFCLRGRFPGLYAIPQRVGTSVFAHRQRITPVNGLPDRKLMVVNSFYGCFAFDVTGPWT